MNLQLSDDTFTITLEGWEQLWAAHLGKTIYLPVDHIVEVSVGQPQDIWDGIRAPGTFVPGLIRAGTYYTQQGREFWYVTRQGSSLESTVALCVNLTKQEYYKRVVLAVPNCRDWGDRLQSRLVGKGATGGETTPS